ncbi:MAG: hypothetical protein OEV91_09525 [Desulfobulbaceae bacterium]|nr:hypothetical protein [Desulfobulbaceae bacterium]
MDAGLFYLEATNMQGLLSGMGGGEPQANGQDDQRQTENFLLNGMDIIHNEQTRDNILEALKHGEPTDTVANLAWTVLTKLEQSAEQSGKQLSDNVKMNGGNALIGEIIEVGQLAGVLPEMSEEERALSLQKVVAKYMEREIKAGRINPQELQQAGQQASQKLGLNMKSAQSQLFGGQKEAA